MVSTVLCCLLVGFIDIMPDFPTVAAQEVAATDGPPLVIKVWDTRACPVGARAEAEIVAKLAATHWRFGKHYTVVRSDGGICPEFYWKGERFSSEGYTNLDEWLRRLKEVMGESGGMDLLPQVGETPEPPDVISPSRVSLPSFIPPARRAWTGPVGTRESAINHLLSHPAHRGKFTRAYLESLDLQSLRNLHSHDHEGTVGLYQDDLTVRSPAPVRWVAAPVRRVLNCVNCRQ